MVPPVTIPPVNKRASLINEPVQKKKVEPEQDRWKASLQ